MKEAPPRPARPRRLSDEEIELWIAVARSVRRRKGAALPAAHRSRPAAAPTSREAEPPRAAPAQRPAGRPALAPLEKRLRRSLARGRAIVDGAVDLHGMSQAQAHAALRGFLAGAQARGERLVVVVTGTGAGRGGAWRSPATDAPGVLRRSVPHWLQAPDLRAIVLGFEEAGRAHGGAGALYVRLKRAGRAPSR